LPAATVREPDDYGVNAGVGKDICDKFRWFAGWLTAAAQQNWPSRMVRVSVADSNRLFAELVDWNDILKDVSLDHLAELDDLANDQMDADKAIKEALGGGHD
jgi:hypothetical protein